MAIRTGYSLPMGKVDADPADKMSEFLGGQVPFLFDIGGKVIPQLFVGGYVGFGFGGPAGEFKNSCDANGYSCLSFSVRAGPEIIYSILPGEMADPWLGYGFGFESTGVSGSQNGSTSSASFSGFEFAHLMAGVDFRVSSGFGIGPFVDFSAGSYNHLHVDSPTATEDFSITNTASHQWLTLGARFVIFP
jgi:hypothetical protein